MKNPLPERTVLNLCEQWKSCPAVCRGIVQAWRNDGGKPSNVNDFLNDLFGFGSTMPW